MNEKEEFLTLIFPTLLKQLLIFVELRKFTGRNPISKNLLNVFILYINPLHPYFHNIVR